MNIEDLPPLLTSRQAADLLQVLPQQITRLCKEKRVLSIKIGREWRINRDSLLSYVGLK